MSDNQLTIKIELPEVVNATFKPVANSIGQTLAHAWEGFTMGLETWYGKKKIDSENSLRLYAEEVSNRLSAIPEENLQDPKMNILGPALEASKFYFEEPQYREMFSKLIAASCDTRATDKAHPFFVEAIKQLTPNEAKILETFKGKHNQPIACYQLKRENGSTNMLMEHVFLLKGSSTFEKEPDYYASSLVNLQRLGFLSINYEQWIADESVYDVFKTSTYYKLNKVPFESDPEIRSLDVQKGLISITPLGLDFLSICV
jgi:hypothetical protein